MFARYDAVSGVPAWLLTDRLGSVRDVLNNGSVVKDTIVYDGFGNITSETDSTWRGRYAWTGRELDTETNLQYNRARYYDGATGRWISQDPLGFDAGDSNLYRYLSNKPTNATDPSGYSTHITVSDNGNAYKYKCLGGGSLSFPAFLLDNVLAAEKKNGGPLDCFQLIKLISPQQARPTRPTNPFLPKSSCQVYICSRVAQIPGGAYGAEWCGEYHQWIVIVGPPKMSIVIGPSGVLIPVFVPDKTSIGMGNDRGVPGGCPDLPYITPTCCVDHSKEPEDFRTYCMFVDVECLKSHLKEGRKTGKWAPFTNDCNTFVEDAIQKSTPTYIWDSDRSRLIAVVIECAPDGTFCHRKAKDVTCYWEPPRKLPPARLRPGTNPVFDPVAFKPYR